MKSIPIVDLVSVFVRAQGVSDFEHEIHANC
jgi:hypothetical protein